MSTIRRNSLISDVIPYKLCEYIKGDGNSWINTDIYLSNSLSFKFRCTGGTFTYGCIFGGEYQSWIPRIVFTNSNAFFGDKMKNESNAPKINDIMVDCYVSYDYYTINGQVYNYSGTISNAYHNYNSTFLSLFSIHISSNNTNRLTNDCAINYFKAFDNGILIRDFVPVLDFNNVPCMYDKVTKKLFYNMGTGSFTYQLKS